MTRKLRLLLIIGAAAASLAVPSTAMAVNFPVDTLVDESSAAATNDGVCDSDPGVGLRCSLRAAIEESNGTAGTDSITFNVTGEHTLTLGVALQIMQPVTITGNGSGATGTRIDGNSATRVFNISVGVMDQVNLNDLRIQDGMVTTGGTNGGAGITVTTGQTVNLNNVFVTNNAVTGTVTPGQGGGIVNNNGAATLNLTNGSSVSGNTVGVTMQNSEGGGIYSQGPVNITNSTIDGNTLTGGGNELGAGVVVNSAFTILRSTFSDNTGATIAGGLQDNGFAAAPRSIENSTFSGNAAGVNGGGGAVLTSNVSVFHSTFANNTATSNGADLRIGANTTTVSNSILGSTGGACHVAAGTLTSGSHNIQRDASCGFGATGDQTADPMLAGLALNPPGLTETHAPNPGSPAIDTADPADCGTTVTTDQRGVSRPQPAGGQCDKGSYELVPPTTPPPGGGGTTPLTPVTPVTATPDNSAECAALRAKLKKARSKRKKRKIRQQLKKLGC